MTTHDRTTEPLVCAAVVTYNGRRFLEGCCRALTQTSYGNMRLLLIDNGGSDGSGEYVASEFPEVEVVRVVPNAGYARGENAAIRRAMEHDADYVVVCNDDVEMIDTRWLAEAVRAAELDPRVGMVGFTEVTTVDAPLPRAVEANETAHVVGFALLLRISMLRTIGMFDETYFIFGDEDDLAARAAQAGYRLLRLNVPIMHFGGGAQPRRSRRSAYFQMRNGLRYCLKNRGPLRVPARAARILDVACNPWPVSLDPCDVGHLRMRNTGNVFVNLSLFAAAIGWNAAVLPGTLRARWRDAARCRNAKAALEESLRLAGCCARPSLASDATTESSTASPDELCCVGGSSNHAEPVDARDSIAAAHSVIRQPESDR